ncbi:uncharacterized protein THITE_2108166 [Thermothielavioides terrestris NRRL 8126]|uniref:PH domain-containing protein n=1 Tax=Thermothielavioides terrestris (strain ATCC 38088 / NRRL 8126) TaxID=578455 RepID=G2QXV6_THETT|nr:uncharacterized protein THITE_2108166 [Thermothielavioides terrestris NRRL 8126]AEO63224.1 hypothetical protein THITE_2108166 [Thermothielavioides terrestris NRRL 8126]
MSPAKEDEPRLADPVTPRRTSAAKHGNATTPASRRASAQARATPKSAPAATGQNPSHRKKPEPTLLGDFFLGRPSPARVAAQREAMRHRRKSMAADAANVREELRQEMRAAAVRRLQQPGGVTERVKAWQKANAAAMKQQGGGVPHAEDAASEPTEVAVHVPAESVTEEDRVRIKMRQKPKKKKVKAERSEEKENLGDGDGEETEREQLAGRDSGVASKAPPLVKNAPKKRIVSDDNWMKRRKGGSPPRAAPPKPKAEGSPMPLPKDFLQRTAQNPSVQSKIKDWAERVELPDPQPPRVKRSRHRNSGATVTVEADAPSMPASEPDTPAPPPPPAVDGIRVKPMKPSKSKSDTDDGIRVTPLRKKEPPDDGIRVRPVEAKLPDDGIRVRPIDDPLLDDDVREHSAGQTPTEDLSIHPQPSRLTSPERNTGAPSRRRERSPDDVIEVMEEAETEIETPTKRKASRRRMRQRNRSPSPILRTVEPAGDQHSESETARHIPPRDGSDDNSEIIAPTVLGNKSLADIPFGYSAFSELDLPLGADGRTTTKKPKAQRNPSFKAVPKVFKKVVTGAKDIIQEMAEPPRPVVANQPQSIESWLNGTVDPFVELAPKEPAVKEPKPEEPAPKAQVNTRELTPEAPKLASDIKKQPSPRPPSPGQRKETPVSSAPKKPEPAKEPDSQREESDTTPRKAKSPVTQSTALKRRRATRVAPSSAKSGGRKPFRELLKEAFRGESGGHKLPPTVYPSCETDDDKGSYSGEDNWESADERDRSNDPGKRPASSDYSSAYFSSTYDSTLSSDLSSQSPPRRRPPTNGVHELSTIVSEEPFSTTGSETRSDVSQTTVTQTTAFTKSTGVTRQESRKPSLKRRLTKHSDLVSVLSLPDNGQLVPPSRSKSIKSSRSIHRRPSRASKSNLDKLLDEFADDEHFYGRELKTLVDGVIPVLLRDVTNGEAKVPQADAMAKSVVNMGMALEKLKAFHQRVPLADIDALFLWLEDVSPIYDNYLDVWRLGFQGLVINLAPKHGRFDDNDSLLNAVSLNEDGDVIGENGERVDVAFLLKRPLIRVKWMVKFLKAAAAVTATPEAERLLSVFAALQEKARRRHREETARMMDEDANNTDTTRCRDLRNLLPLGGVMMNRTRQVAALDVFSLDLDHSSGQRLECQVEMIFRDNPAVPSDKGDILIREISNNARSWLLFPPVPRQNISARLGDDKYSLVAMIRGTHNGNEWFELLKLSTNDEEQVEYWLRVLGSHPLPPAARIRSSGVVQEASSPKSGSTDVPVGERRHSMSALEFSDSERPNTSSRHRTQQDDGAAPQASSADTSPARTPTRENYPQNSAEDDRRRPSWETPFNTSPKIVRPLPNTTPYREDGAPPPPIHRTFGPKSPGLLSPPVEIGPQARLKRRMSSPLKHEYHPSDVSSESSSSVSDDDSESSQSSSDDLDEDEVPDTIPGYSIKETDAAPVESVVSENSITPSNSASQVAVAHENNAKPERPMQQFVASVSYWSSRKGMWRDINNGKSASVVVRPGCMEVHYLDEQYSNRQAYPLQSSGTSEVDNSNKDAGSVVPLVVLVLTPVVMIRRSTALDLEVRSPASPEARLKIEANMFRFRTATQDEAKELYEAVHISRLNNARYIQLSEEARVRSFGQMQAAPGEGSADGDGSSRRRSWFGRKNSYRASTRAPSVSQGSVSTTISAASFLRRLMGGGDNTSYNIDESTLDKQRPASAAPGGGSLYTSSSASGSGSSTPPRSASVSLSGSGSHSQSRWSYGLAKPFSPDQPLEIRCHLNVQNNRWLDKGNCVLHISRPPPGVRQELPIYHGLEKRVIVTHATKRSGDRPLILLDAVLGSKCFSMLGTKGIMCSVWENLRDEEGNVGVVPRHGVVGGKVTKWCFQCKSVQQAGWIMKLLTSEVPGLMMG